MGISAESAWGIILGAEKTNLMEYNSSFERGTAGAAAIQGATLGSASDNQAFGAWSLSVAPTSNGTSGAYVGTFTAGNGTQYTYSAYVLGSAGVGYMLAVADTSNALVGSVLFTGGGTWQRYSGTFTEASGATRRVIVRKANGANAASQGTFYVDGVQAEAGLLTTYIDGEQEGCSWTGQPYASQSLRDGQSRAGGTILALADLGYDVGFHSGIGMPPVENSALPYALLDGAEYQRTRAAARVFTLTDVAVASNSREAFHAVRRTLIDAIKPDRVTPQQPTRFVYLGAGGTSFIDAVYTGGMELNDLVSVQAENTAIQFTAFDPYFYAELDRGTALAGSVGLGSTNFVAARDRYGRWGTMGRAGAGTSLNAYVTSLLYTNGTLLAGGSFTSAGGTTANRIAQWNGVWGTLNGGGLNETVNALARNPGGTIFVGGGFSQAGGTNTQNMARYVGGAWGTLVNGTVNNTVYALAYAPTGTLFVGGILTTAGGTQARGIAQYTTAWGTLTGGTLVGAGLQPEVDALVWQTDTLYVGGEIQSAAATAAYNIAFWRGSWGTMQGGGTASGAFLSSAVNALLALPSAEIVAGGYIETLGPGTVRRVGQWNGVQWSPLGSGVTDASGYVESLGYDPVTGITYVGGIFTNVNQLRTADGLAAWTGAAWITPDIDVAGNGTILAMAAAGNGTFYIGGAFSGTANAASVTTINNPGMAVAYPVVEINNASAGTARVFQLLNTLTGDRIYFNLSLLPGETATLDLRPGDRGFTTDFRGNVFNTIVPGSNVATWKLLPGTNYISFYSDSGSVQTSFYFRPRHHSADGTV